VADRAGLGSRPDDSRRGPRRPDRYPSKCQGPDRHPTFFGANDTRWAASACPALSYAIWLSHYYYNEEKASRDWAIYWKNRDRGVWEAFRRLTGRG
jgi:hypothetical protein